MEEVCIEFDGATAADANRYASELKDDIARIAPEANTVVERGADSTQDFGTLLSIFLGSASVTAVARGLQVWLTKRDSATVTIKTKQGTILAKGVSAKDAKAMFEKALKAL